MINRIAFLIYFLVLDLLLMNDKLG